MGGLKWAIWASGGSYNSLSHSLQNLPLTLPRGDHDDDKKGDDDVISIYLMEGLFVQEVGEGLLVIVDPIKVGAMVEQGLDDRGLGGLVEGGRVQRRVAFAVHGVGVGTALEQEADCRHGWEDADGVATNLLVVVLYDSVEDLKTRRLGHYR